jgi:hypothetical protein
MVTRFDRERKRQRKQVGECRTDENRDAENFRSSAAEN